MNFTLFPKLGKYWRKASERQTKGASGRVSRTYFAPTPTKALSLLTNYSRYSSSARRRNYTLIANSPRKRLVKASPGLRARLNCLVMPPPGAISCFRRLVKRQKNVGWSFNRLVTAWKSAGRNFNCLSTHQTKENRSWMFIYAHLRSWFVTRSCFLSFLMTKKITVQTFEPGMRSKLLRSQSTDGEAILCRTQ